MISEYYFYKYRENLVNPLCIKVMPIFYHTEALSCVYYFDVGVTFEMREPNTEKSIFRLIKIVAAQRLINGRRKGKVAERQRGRVCVCLRVLVETKIASISIRMQRGKRYI